VPVIIAEERAEQIGLVELQLEAGAAGIIGDRRIAAGHQDTVTPAKAGVSGRRGAAANPAEIPAFAGMTN
jgi:hypothetical protein